MKRTLPNIFLRFNRGFTLIELVVTVAIMAILSGMSVVGYNKFNESQTVNQAANNLASDLRLAQQNALSGNKPTGCSGDLHGWKVVIASPSYRLWAICDADVGDKTVTITPLTLTATGGNDVIFAALTGAESGTTSITINGNLGGTAYSKTITVTTAGAISVAN